MSVFLLENENENENENEITKNWFLNNIMIYFIKS